MKKITILLVLLFCVFQIFAQNKDEKETCAIEFISHGSIKVQSSKGCLHKGVGDYISDGQKIIWEDSLQYIRVWNMVSESKEHIPARYFYDNKQEKSIKDYMIYIHPLGTKGAADDYMGELLSRRFYMIGDTLRIACNLNLDEQHVYLAKEIGENGAVDGFAVQVDDETNELVFAKSYLVDSVGLSLRKNRPVCFQLLYIHNCNMIESASTDNFEIIYITTK